LKIVFYIPIQILCPTRLVGKKNITKGASVVVSNHQSNWDCIVLSTKFAKQPYFLAKQEMFKGKFIAGIVKHLGGIAVNRQQVAPSTIKNVFAKLKSGKRVIIFPEGTRHKITTLEADAMKNGAAMFALKTEVPIIPMLFVKKPRLFRFNKLVVGKPISLEQYKGQKVTKEIIDEVGEKIRLSMLELKEQNVVKKGKTKLQKQNKIKC